MLVDKSLPGVVVGLSLGFLLWVNPLAAAEEPLSVPVTKIPVAPISLNIAAIDWCPQICPDATENPGYLVESLIDLFKGSEYQLNFSYSSWTDAIRRVEEGSFDGLLSPSKDEAPNLIYHRDPLAYQTHCFWTLTDADWQFNNISELKNNSIVIYRDHSYGTLLSGYLSDNYKKYVFELMYDKSYIDRAYRLLEIGRASALLFTTNSVLHFQRTNSNKALKMGSCIKKDELWLGLSPKNPTKIGQLKGYIDNHLATYRDSVKHQLLLKKYDILVPEIQSIQ